MKKKIEKTQGNKKYAIAKTVAILPAAANIVAMNAMTVFAKGDGGNSTGVTEIDSGMKAIKMIAIGIVSMIGIVTLVKGAMDLGTGISQRDSSSITTGAGELAGGLIMAAVGAVIAVLGF